MSSSDLVAVVCMSLAVFLPKAVPMVLVSDRLPSWLRRWLDYVAPAVLAALVAPSVVLSNGAVGSPRLEQLAFVVTLVVALLSRRALLSVAVGVAVLIGVVLYGGMSASG